MLLTHIASSIFSRAKNDGAKYSALVYSITAMIQVETNDKVTFLHFKITFQNYESNNNRIYVSKLVIEKLKLILYETDR